MTVPLLTEEQIEEFIEKGYVIIPDAMPVELLDAAQAHCDEAYDSGNYNRKQKIGSEVGIPAFDWKVKGAAVVMESGAQTVAQQLLGEDKIALRVNMGQVAYITQSEVFAEEGGWTATQHLKKRKWHIDAGDGDHGDVGSEFSVLLGIALSEGQEVDENRGQLTVFPGSHGKVHRFLRETIRNTAEGEDAIAKFKRDKKDLDIGEPVRVCMKRGDLLIAHQRLAHVPGVNLTEMVRKNVYFRVARKDLDEIVEKIWKSDEPWVGFEGIAEHLPEGVTEVV